MKLSLNSNQLTDKGATFLAKNNTITKLELKNNNIDIVGITAFFQNKTLVDLQLRNNKIDNNQLNPLNTHLKRNLKRVQHFRKSVICLLLIANSNDENPLTPYHNNTLVLTMIFTQLARVLNVSPLWLGTVKTRDSYLALTFNEKSKNTVCVEDDCLNLVNNQKNNHRRSNSNRLFSSEANEKGKLLKKALIQKISI